MDGPDEALFPDDRTDVAEDDGLAVADDAALVVAAAREEESASLEAAEPARLTADGEDNAPARDDDVFPEELVPPSETGTGHPAPAAATINTHGTLDCARMAPP